MIYERPKGGTFRFSDNASRLIYQYLQLGSEMPEAGGILLGRMFLDYADVIVDIVTVPGRGDAFGRFHFVRARQPTQTAIDRAWEVSGGVQIYLGEWHTHPEDRPSPSHKDLFNWNRIAKTGRFEQNALFFVIAGRQITRVWEVPRGGGESGAASRSKHRRV